MWWCGKGQNLGYEDRDASCCYFVLVFVDKSVIVRENDRYNFSMFMAGFDV